MGSSLSDRRRSPRSAQDPHHPGPLLPPPPNPPPREKRETSKSAPTGFPSPGEGGWEGAGEGTGVRASGRGLSEATPEGEGLAGLDLDQRAAAEIVDGPLLIVAGPGTGKTRTLTHRLAYLIAERGAAPENCLAVTFSRRAAAEMEERLAALLPEAAGRVLVATFHGLGLTLL